MNQTTDIKVSASKAFGEDIESMIETALPEERWFGAKGETVCSCRIADLAFLDERSALAFTEVSFAGGRNSELYLLALSVGSKDTSAALRDEDFCKKLLGTILRGESRQSSCGMIKAGTFAETNEDELHSLPRPSFSSLEQSNSSFRFEDKYFIKIFRKLDQGINPEIELGAHFAARSPFSNATSLIGFLTYERDGKEYSLAALHKYIDARASAWDLFLGELTSASAFISGHGETPPGRGETSAMFTPPPLTESNRLFLEHIASAADLVTLLGRRTGEMHKALANDSGDETFTPKKLDYDYRHELRNSISERLDRVCGKLAGFDRNHETAGFILDNRDLIRKHLAALDLKTFGGSLIRIHGDYHLGQVVFTGKDFIILDFEGEPLRPIGERRQKRMPLQDVAGMLRSIDYSIHFFMKEKMECNEEKDRLGPWLRLWRRQMCSSFFGGYLKAADMDILPETIADIRHLTEILMLEKALYEIEYELSSRPDWVSIPLYGLEDLILGLADTKDEVL